MMQVLANRKARVSDRSATAVRRAAGTCALPVECLRAWTTLALLAISLLAAPAAAQEGCDHYPDWTDIDWFRSCADERGKDWATELLGDAARLPITRRSSRCCCSRRGPALGG